MSKPLSAPPELTAVLEMLQNDAALGIGSQAAVEAFEAQIRELCRPLAEDQPEAAAVQHVAEADQLWTDFLAQHSHAPVLDDPQNFAVLQEQVQDWLAQQDYSITVSELHDFHLVPPADGF